MDSRLHALAQTLAHRPTEAVARDEITREAAVALLVRPRAQLELLLIKRAVNERDPWSGHMALPGGRRDPSDQDLQDTAYRETMEEIGVALQQGCLLGLLDEVSPRTPRLPPILIAPFVVGVPEGTEVGELSHEVEAAVWVPLPALREPGAVSELLIEFEGGSQAFPSLLYGDYVIWGLTHRIITQFIDVLERSGL